MLPAFRVLADDKPMRSVDSAALAFCSVVVSDAKTVKSTSDDPPRSKAPIFQNFPLVAGSVPTPSEGTLWYLASECIILHQEGTLHTSCQELDEALTELRL